MFSYETRLSNCRFLEIIFFLHVLLNIVPAHADSSSALCANQWNRIRIFHQLPTLVPGASFKTISEARGTLAKLKKETPTEVTLKDRVTWFRANHQRLVEPQYDYSPRTFGMWSKVSIPIDEGPIPTHDLMKAQNDWLGGVAYVNTNADGKPLTLDLLKELHKRSCANMAFRGFEGRRIAKRLREGEITKDEFRALLNRAYKDESVSGIDHRTLVGELRNDPIDQLAHHGNQTDASGRRYMTETEFKGLSSNPNLTLVPGSMTNEPDGKIRAEFRYLSVEKVETRVKEILEKTNQQITSANSIDEKVRAVVTMQRDLLSAHPFLDGNGRTVRLLADLLYNRMGLPHPARPNEHDLEMPIDEAVEFVRDQMIRTLKIESGELEI